MCEHKASSIPETKIPTLICLFVGKLGRKCSPLLPRLRNSLQVCLTQTDQTVAPQMRMGKGNTYREVPLNAEVRTALDTWLEQRKKLAVQQNESALFLTKQGTRLATRTIDEVLRRLAQDANLSLSAHTLRHSCLTNLVRNGNDLVLVAELAGHKRLETTRRYSLPTAADREAAMERLKVDY